MAPTDETKTKPTSNWASSSPLYITNWATQARWQTITWEAQMMSVCYYLLLATNTKLYQCFKAQTHSGNLQSRYLYSIWTEPNILQKKTLLLPSVIVQNLIMYMNGSDSCRLEPGILESMEITNPVQWLPHNGDFGKPLGCTPSWSWSQGLSTITWRRRGWFSPLSSPSLWQRQLQLLLLVVVVAAQLDVCHLGF